MARNINISLTGKYSSLRGKTSCRISRAEMITSAHVHPCRVVVCSDSVWFNSSVTPFLLQISSVLYLLLQHGSQQRCQTRNVSMSSMGTVKTSLCKTRISSFPVQCLCGVSTQLARCQYLQVNLNSHMFSYFCRCSTHTFMHNESIPFMHHAFSVGQFNHMF